MKNFFAVLGSFLTKMHSADNSLSWGRCAASFMTFYFATQHAWFYHRTGHLVDLATVLGHFSIVGTLYGGSKVPSTVNLNGSNNGK